MNDHRNPARLADWRRRYCLATGNPPDATTHVRQMIGHLAFPLEDRWPTRDEIIDRYRSLFNSAAQNTETPALLRRQAC